jgi:hypothetical protein
MVSLYAMESNNCSGVKRGRFFFARTWSDDASRFRAGWIGLKLLLGLAQLFFRHAIILNHGYRRYGFYKDGVELLLLKMCLETSEFQRPFKVVHNKCNS